MIDSAEIPSDWADGLNVGSLMRQRSFRATLWWVMFNKTRSTEGLTAEDSSLHTENLDCILHRSWKDQHMIGCWILVWCAPQGFLKAIATKALASVYETVLVDQFHLISLVVPWSSIVGLFIRACYLHRGQALTFAHTYTILWTCAYTLHAS